MALDIQLSDDPRGMVVTMVGQLDTDTAHQLDTVVARLQHQPPSVLVLHLRDLNYISSAGLRYIFQMKKLMKQEQGRFVISEPSPQVKKVLEIVQAVPIKSIFSSVEELDAYLDQMQKQVGEDL